VSKVCGICKGEIEKIKTINWCVECGSLLVRSRTKDGSYYTEMRRPKRINKTPPSNRNYISLIKEFVNSKIKTNPLIKNRFFNTTKRIK
jgi:hypothetical protein